MIIPLVKVCFLHADWSVSLFMTYTQRFIPVQNRNTVCVILLNLTYCTIFHFHLSLVFIGFVMLLMKSTYEVCCSCTRVTSLRVRIKYGAQLRLFLLAKWKRFRKLEKQRLTLWLVDYGISLISTVKLRILKPSPDRKSVV